MVVRIREYLSSVDVDCRGLSPLVLCCLRLLSHISWLDFASRRCSCRSRGHNRECRRWSSGAPYNYRSQAATCRRQSRRYCRRQKLTPVCSYTLVTKATTIEIDHSRQHCRRCVRGALSYFVIRAEWQAIFRNGFVNGMFCNPFRNSINSIYSYDY